MGAASASSQSSAMPQSQGKGGGAPMQQGGVGAPMSGGKGFSNQQPYSPNSGAPTQQTASMPNDGSQVGVSSAGGPFGQFADQINLAQSTQANPSSGPVNGTPLPQGAGQQGKGGGAPAQQAGSSVEDTYHQQLGRDADPEGLAYWKGQFGDTVDPGELKSFQTAAAPELAGRPQPTAPQGKGGGAQASTQSSSQSGPNLPNAGQQGWQYGQGASGNRVTYPSTSGQQQFGQPMPYSNTIGQGQQSNQMGSSGKGKGA